MVSYVLGTFPSAVLVARSRGVDITTQGSGNPGASNVGRTLGWQRGVLVFTLDAAKGAIAAGLGLIVAERPEAYACAAAAVLGHMFPVTRRAADRFRGGKGVAAVGGAMFVVQPLLSTLLTGVWFAVSKLTKKASLASIAIAVLMPIGMAVRGTPGWEIVATAGLGAMVIARHWPNIRRLMQREELSLGKNR